MSTHLQNEHLMFQGSFIINTTRNHKGIAFIHCYLRKKNPQVYNKNIDISNATLYILLKSSFSFKGCSFPFSFFDETSLSLEHHLELPSTSNLTAHQTNFQPSSILYFLVMTYYAGFD